MSEQRTLNRCLSLARRSLDVAVRFTVTETVLGQVERVIFENEETSFRVIRLKNVSGLQEQTRTTIVGVMQALGPGSQVRVTGRLEVDKQYGERIKVESVVLVAPDTLEGVETYLGSGVIRGVGPVYAKRIVKYFGVDCLRVLDAEPHRLAEVPGLGKVLVEQVREAWIEHRVTSNVILSLQAHGASAALAARIIECFGVKAQEIVETRPYRLAMDVKGIGFKTADRIARSQGLPLDHPERAQAGVLHELNLRSEGGHCYCLRESLVMKTSEMLGVADSHIESAIDALWAGEYLVIEEKMVYLRKIYQAEKKVAERIAALLSAPSQSIKGLPRLLEIFEAEQNMSLAVAQREAVHAAASKKFLVVTGGPGVGKTTLVRAIIAAFSGEKLRIHLAAPTGRAAKRLGESTGRKTTTLHRLLEVGGGANGFAKNNDNPIRTDLLIVDEASMIDVQLAASLLDAVPNAARVVLVGDADQLPSVGPGAFLKDLIACEAVPVARLEVIFRQGAESGIIENSHKILKGLLPEGSVDPAGDFFIIQCSDPKRAREMVREVVTQRIPARFGLDAKRDVQVLTPMHRGDAGTLALNKMLQNDLNPQGESLVRENGELRVGDKVMQLKNDYDRDVFNGDVGEVFQVETDNQALTVCYDGEEARRLVTYEKSELSQLALAYATTIHKSQGSEYPAVVIPFLNAHFVMLSRNLLYTAITRAKKLCVLVADKRAISLALNETRRELRDTGLAARIDRAVSSLGL